MAVVPTAKATILQKGTLCHCMSPAFRTLSQHSTRKTLLRLLSRIEPALLAQRRDPLEGSYGDSNTLFRSDVLCHHPNTGRINQFYWSTK
jgi:hypothetical protein